MKAYTKFIILILLLNYSSFVASQNYLKTDTIDCINYKLIIDIPARSHSHIDKYEEGFFRTITCYLDSAIITIHFGAMVNLPLIDLSKYTVTSNFIFDKEIQIQRGYYENEINGVKRKKFFREENYLKHGITFMYENVDESRLPFYDSILNNIKILKTENRTDLG